MITLLGLLAVLWMLALTWAVLETYSIVTQWLAEKFHGHGGTHNVE